MTFSLDQLAHALGERGMPTVVDGDGSCSIRGVNTLADATSDEISFLANPRYEKYLQTTSAAAVLVDHNLRPPKNLNLLRTAEPYCALREAIDLVHGERQHPQWGIHPQACISPSASVGAGANIGPHVTIEDGVSVGQNAVIYPGCYIGRDSTVGDNVTLYASVVIYDGATLGHNVVIHSGTVVGEDGLGYARAGEHSRKFAHVGNVVIEDDVEIGANCAIDRAMLGTTLIGRGTKFSNLIAIGHGSKVGPDSMFVAQVGLAGSVTVGRHVMMGGQAGVAGHVHIGERANIGAKAGVANDVDAKEFVLGQPAIRAADAKRVISITQRLPEMKQRLKQLETEIAEIRIALASSVAD